jgi:hypothetical protein
MSLILVDCEGHGPAPGLNDDVRFEFGAVDFETRQTFHGHGGTKETFNEFSIWLEGDQAWSGASLVPLKPPLIFVSDNPAYDWQFINYYFHKFLGRNPFGHSARRIGDFYAGLMRDFRAPGREWKKFRRTVHDHNPVNDAMGNAEALERLFKMMERKT